MNDTFSPHSKSNRPSRGAPSKIVSPKMARKEQPQTIVVSSFDGTYLGHVIARDTGDRTRLCSESAAQMLKTICQTGKNPKRPFSAVVTHKGINLVEAATGQTAAYIPLKDVVCISLNSKSKDSAKAKIVSLLACDRAAAIQDGEPAKFICHVFRLESIEKNWAFYRMVTAMSEQHQKTASNTSLSDTPPPPRVGWA